MTWRRITNPNNIIRFVSRSANVTSILIVMVSAMAWPAGYGLGVILRHLQVVGR